MSSSSLEHLSSHTHFTEPTTTYWQTLLPPSPFPSSPPYQYFYPAVLPDSRILRLPIRPLTDPTLAVASLLVNQASLEVVEELSKFLAEEVREMGAEVVIGLPTLGLALAGGVAKELGLSRYIPLGYSIKFWYSSQLSTSISSITSPTPKTLYLDPNLLPLVLNKRCLIIDDAVSLGTTLKATWDFLEGLGVDVVGCGVVMVQGRKWESVLGERRKALVRGVFESPLLKKVEDGWGLRD